LQLFEGLLAQVHREADVIEQRTENGELIVTARLANNLCCTTPAGRRYREILGYF
jgi:hypothetical protein